MYKKKVMYENLEKIYCAYEGKYEIPTLEKINIYECPELISFNYAKSIKNKGDKGLHFFIDDYQFTRLWNRPNDYINLLHQFQFVLTPDFSLYTDFPVAMQIYNHYRKHWLGAYWQSKGIKVIPTICWGDEKSFDWCFDGEPKNSTVAVSSVGTQKDEYEKDLFRTGYEEMLKRLEPEKVIFYGCVPNDCRGNIVQIKAFQDKYKELKINGYKN